MTDPTYDPDDLAAAEAELALEPAEEDDPDAVDEPPTEENA